MFDRDLVTSGFDTETLLSERYLTYLLMAQVDAGLLPLQFDVQVPLTSIDFSITLHLPAGEDYRQVYSPSDTVPMPPQTQGSFDVELLPGQDAAFADVAFTPDGTRLLTRSLDNLVRVWNIEERRQDETAAFEVNVAIGSVFNTACTQIATASLDRSVRIWDIASKAVIAQLEAHTLAVECVAFSPDGLRLVSGSLDETAIIWDLTTGAPVHTLSGHEGRVSSVAFSRDGTHVVTGGQDGTVRMWDTQTGLALHVFTGHAAIVNCVVFSPDNRQIASASDDATVRLWHAVTGELEETIDGHDGPVLWVDIGVNGLRLLSGSKDNNVRLWAENGDFLAMIPDHHADVTRVRFADSTNDRNVSVSAGGSIRVWDDLDDAETLELRRDFLSVRVFVDIVNNSQPEEPRRTFELVSLFGLALTADETSNGLERNHRLHLSFARLSDQTRALLALGGIPPGVIRLIEDTIRQRLAIDVPFGIAQGQRVQQVRLRTFTQGDTRTLGIYVNLALRSSPTEFLPPRGTLALAQDFRVQDPGESFAIAFATSPGLFALLGPDAKFQQAEEIPGTSDFRFPIREDASDTTSKRIGTIHTIVIGPELTPTSPPLPTGQLRVAVDMTYTDINPDIGLTANFLFKPDRDQNGRVDWESSVDVDLGLLAMALIAVVGVIILVPFLAPAGIGFALLVGVLQGVVGGKDLAEHFAAKRIAEEVDVERQASVLDSVPVRLTAATRRWDPFYDTLHQIVAELDEPLIIDDRGMAFAATEVILDKRPHLRENIAPHEEEREMQGVSAITYEVPDLAEFEADLEAEGFGVDRMDFERKDPVNQPTLVTLTIEQIMERRDIGAEADKRIFAPMVLDARRIVLHAGQIDQLLCCTWRVRTEHRIRLIGGFRDLRKDEIRAEVVQEFEDQGIPATEEQIDQETDKRFAETIDDDLKEYKDGVLRDDLHAALAPLLHFDLAPEEMVRLQEQRVFVIDGKEIIVRHNKDGTETPYYRDHPDRDRRDDLLALPTYSFPYEPPQ